MSLVLILHDIRSAHNIGSMFRTADGAGVSELVLTGYTMSPAKEQAPYLTRAEKDLAKTALGAERAVPWRRFDSLEEAVRALREEQYEVVALEQSGNSIRYDEYLPRRERTALIVGTEVDGLGESELALADSVIEIPMRGTKESLNVSVAAGIAMYAIMGTGRVTHSRLAV